MEIKERLYLELARIICCCFANEIMELSAAD